MAKVNTKKDDKEQNLSQVKTKDSSEAKGSAKETETGLQVKKEKTTEAEVQVESLLKMLSDPELAQYIVSKGRNPIDKALKTLIAKMNAIEDQETRTEPDEPGICGTCDLPRNRCVYCTTEEWSDLAECYVIDQFGLVCKQHASQVRVDYIVKKEEDLKLYYRHRMGDKRFKMCSCDPEDKDYCRPGLRRPCICRAQYDDAPSD
jgi:hypothetical protein